MTGEANAAEGHADASANFDPDDAEQDRESAVATQDEVKHRVVGMIVFFDLTGEAFVLAEDCFERAELFYGCFSEPVPHDLTGEPVEFCQRPHIIDGTQGLRDGERQ